ncbi:hypothetical protein OEZ85_011714 [Tetradesmus obliquus]|uniref:Nitrate reductase n=1 Tax=Tetradesmus obliquus TaxID=3088 RepID=A0ABY8TR65_TETOB|nr:hypothetical protein OEZ85_011714 [Tetradesmus obliquus]
MGRGKDSNSQQSAGDSKGPSHVQITGNAPRDHAVLPDALGAAAAASSGEDQQQGAAPEEPPLHDDDPSWSFHESAAHVDPRDKATPDAWIRRNPHLIRLTGNHPLNAIPPAALLAERAFITPVSLHYVRNHGAVPRLEWQSHKVAIDGMVEHPAQLSMQQLLAMAPPATVTAYMACTGNRRKELRVLKPLQGSDMGRTAVGNSQWTGVPLAAVLQQLGVKSVQQGARWVHFAGPDDELPGGSSYATCLDLEHCLNPANDVLLAYKQNGRLLTPDHGYPLRLLAPGIAGGRQVKWLSHITISDRPTANTHHIRENRRFPESLDRSAADDAGYFDPSNDRAYSFAVMEDCVNSAILLPGHDELVLQRDGSSSSSNEGEVQAADAADGQELQLVTITGYAYTGGGRRVTHVEVSLDGGASWRLAPVSHGGGPSQEDRADNSHLNAYGKHWSWYVWEVDVPFDELAGAPEVRCRACDSAMNSQPERPSWNFLGSMNNSQYAVKIHSQHLAADNDSSSSRLALRFEHPVAEGPGGGIVESAAELQEEEAQGKQWEQLREISMQEVEQHSSREKGVWFVRDGKVYDVTPFLDKHPGGAAIIESLAGQNATDDFDSIHDDRARRMSVQYLIGRLEGAQPPQHPDQAAAKQQHKAALGPQVALNPHKRQTFQLAHKDSVSHDTRLFRFALPTPQHRLGLPVGKHIQLYANIGGEGVVRPYTPTTLDIELGHFDLVVKVYPPAPPKYPQGGKMSQYLDSLAVGDTVEVRGPVGDVEYHGRGRLTFQDASFQVTHINMIGGGTGITPLYQVIKAILQDPADSTQLRLLYANKTPDDILLRQQLDELQQASGGRFKVEYTVDAAAPEGWPHKTGHISADMARAALFGPAAAHSDDTSAGSKGADSDSNGRGSEQSPGGGQQQKQQQSGQLVVTLLCGPPPMIEKACKPALKEMGFEDQHVIEF